MLSVGIDVGYSSVKITVLNSDEEVVLNEYRLHKGRFADVLKEMIINLLSKFNQEQIVYGAITGSIGRNISAEAGLPFIQEVPALVEGSLMIKNDIMGIVEIGGQSSKYITDFMRDDKSTLKISMNTNCSAGTGSFLEEQLSRLNLSLEAFDPLAEESTSVPRIAGRCSVFAKTDIIHHQQEGVPVNDILKGLAYAVTKNFRGSVMKKLPLCLPLIVTGGVAKNRVMVNSLKDILGLNRNDIFVPENCGNVISFGAALIAHEKEMNFPIDLLLVYLSSNRSIVNESVANEYKELSSYGKDDHSGRHECSGFSGRDKSTVCCLGIDTGSTSTNVVVIDENREILSLRYLKTYGDPEAAVKKALESILSECGEDINISGVCVTGSGRYMIGDLVGADIVKDEITAQARAAVLIDPDVDTIFEIGGQDSKYISLENGMVKDFQMNKICAAGTGSFIEEQAVKFNIPVSEFGDIALLGKNPLNLGERCTVFIESSVAEHLAAGAAIEDICAGLCYSVVNNYMDRVVGGRKIGDNIFLQGGLGYNQGVVNAFRSVTGKKITVPPFFSVTGAYGAAIIAMEEMKDQQTKFRGFYPEDRASEKNDKLNASQKESRYSKSVDELVFRGYDPGIDPLKKTVGIPRALFTFGMFQMFYNVFKELGFNVIMSDPTDEKTIVLAQHHSPGETCYPVKLVNGHVADLVQKKVDFIFFPDLYTVDHPGSNTRQNYGCAYMQLAFKVVRETMELDKKGIGLLCPTIAFSFGQEFMMKSFSGMGKILGKKDEDIFRALQKGMMAFKDFEQRLEKNSQAAMDSLNPDEITFVLISKIYGIADPVLNMGIPQMLEDMGYRVLPFYEIPETDISIEHPNMFWPFGQHILESATFVKDKPNMYAIVLTHHGCGPDSVLLHYCREIMKDKPFLCIEVDEHSSGVGVRTRLEAFLNSLDADKFSGRGSEDTTGSETEVQEVFLHSNFENVNENKILYIPHLYPFSSIYSEILQSRGINARVMNASSAESVGQGRKHMISEEYFSMTALLGDVCSCAGERDKNELCEIFLPQTEGAEVEGQYSRLIKSLLDQKGFANVSIFSPFLEDFFQRDESYIESVFLGLIAGDVILHAAPHSRAGYLKTVMENIRKGSFSAESISCIADEISSENSALLSSPRILAVGELYILYNDFLNDSVFTDLDEKRCRVLFSPLSEYCWFFLRDYIYHNKKEEKYKHIIERMKNSMHEISQFLKPVSSFDTDIENLVQKADRIVGYYAGGNGRYRLAKSVFNSVNADGVINVNSMYENTGITLEILQKNLSSKKPVLNMTFDGNKNENDKTKIESFIYYL